MKWRELRRFYFCFGTAFYRLSLLYHKFRFFANAVKSVRVWLKKAVMKKLIANLKKIGVLKTLSVIRAFESVNRADFVSESFRDSAYEDRPLPIGFGQTISQPYTVAFMLELLAARTGQKVLDIGSGSGWTTALLASIVGSKGHVWALEIVPTLFEAAKQKLAKFNLKNATLLNRSGWSGYDKEAPFDRILVSATGKTLPPRLIKQLSPEGRLVIPLIGKSGQEICLFEKTAEDRVAETRYPGFIFVPLINE